MAFYDLQKTHKIEAVKLDRFDTRYLIPGQTMAANALTMRACVWVRRGFSG